MNADERRMQILDLILQSEEPISGAKLAKKFSVSRQIIVSDIASLKNDNDIISTNRGYIIKKPQKVERVLKMIHTDDEIEDELSTIVENGGKVLNVFVWHKIYGKLEAPLKIETLLDVADYMESLKNGRSQPLKKVTSEYHYHTIETDTEEIMDKVSKALDKKGYLVAEKNF